MSSIAVSIIVAIAAVIGYISYKAIGPDNSVEETCEAVIKAETGDTVDISPNEDKLQPAPEVLVLPGANGAAHA